MDFNKRYYEFLGLSINTIILAQKMKFITLEENKIVISKEEIKKFDFSNISLGNRAIGMIQASNKLSNILKQENTDNLYFKLRIEI